MREDQEFIRFCEQLFFGDPLCVWEKLSKEKQEQFCVQAQKARLTLFFLYFLKEHLPESFYLKFRKDYQIESLKCLVEQQDITNFYQFLKSKKIPFIPIKGADLAFHIYPDPVLRPHGDWDILFREKDCPEVIRLLLEHGWQTFSGYAPQGTERDHYHYERMHNGRHVLEVHWTLPNFCDMTSEEIWQETEAVDEYHRVFTPEMNLLLIPAHASAHAYTHLSKWKILQDAAMILKHDTVDWEKVHQLANRANILRPDILFHVWDDFFPAGTLPPEEPGSEQQQLIREIFRTSEITQGKSAYEKQLAMTKRYNLQWLKDRFNRYNPASICLKYHIPAHQNWKIILYGIRDFLEKSFYFLTHFNAKNSQLQTYYQKVAKLEKLIRDEK